MRHRVSAVCSVVLCCAVLRAIVLALLACECPCLCKRRTGAPGQNVNTVRKPLQIERQKIGKSSIMRQYVATC